MSFELNHIERSALIDLADKAIAIGPSRRLAAVPPPDPLTPALESPRGAFVTLKKRDRLRGCIGRMESDDPLWRTVSAMARAAAYEDPRFPPVSTEELGSLGLEISVLTPFRQIESRDDVEIGRDGLMIECRGYRGVLLPQVATEWGWDRETFLDQVCVKAGLQSGAWRRPDATIYAFAALVFGRA